MLYKTHFKKIVNPLKIPKTVPTLLLISTEIYFIISLNHFNNFFTQFDYPAKRLTNDDAKHKQSLSTNSK